MLVWFSGFLKGCPAHSVVDFNRASDIHILGYLLVDIVGTQAAVDSKVKVRIVDVYVSCSSIVCTQNIFHSLQKSQGLLQR